jgi:peptidoglycan/xylan/chitin deacetylase (PgdA/CDA1 family)
VRPSPSWLALLSACLVACAEPAATPSHAQPSCGCETGAGSSAHPRSPSAYPSDSNASTANASIDAAPGEVPSKPDAPFIPVLLFHQVCDDTCGPADTYGVTKADFAAMLASIGAAGYTSITTRDYARARRGDLAGLPGCPIVLTFDDGRLDAYTRADPLLRDARARATMFVITGRQDSSSPGFMSWASVAEAHASGRWDIQLHAAEGHVRIPTGLEAGEVVWSSFFGNRRFDPLAHANASDHLETHETWKARASGDVAAGIAALRQHIEAFEPIAFAVPYSDFGQIHSNDPLIAPELRALFDATFDVWFTQDQADATPPSSHERGRYSIRNTTKVSDVMTWLAKTRLSRKTKLVESGVGAGG